MEADLNLQFDLAMHASKSSRWKEYPSGRNKYCPLNYSISVSKGCDSTITTWARCTNASTFPFKVLI